MVLEMIDAEAVREMLSHSPWGRQFLEALFGSPDGPSMFDAQVASSVPVEHPVADGASSGDENIVVADNGDLAFVAQPVREPTALETLSTGGADQYLDYLTRKLNADLERLEEFHEAVTKGGYVAMGMSADDAQALIDRYQALLMEIEEVKGKIPGNRAQDTLKMLYSKADNLHRTYLG